MNTMKSEIKILYVDDEIINLQLFEINFGRNYKVLTAESGLAGLDILENNPEINIVISDMKMPLMNGIEFIKKAHEKLPDKNYFILTGFEITDEIQNALSSGLIIKYFRKPFNMGEIELAIENTYH